MAHTQKRAVAQGSLKPGGKRGIVIYLDEDTFGQIRERAIKERTSFGEQARQLIEWGLMA